MFFDTHVHLDDEQYKNDLESVIKNAQDKDVKLLINIGVNTEANKASINIAEKYDFIYAACGFHPHDADKFTNEDFKILSELLTHKKVVGVGEIGLDYYRNISGTENQKKVFAKLINLAKEVGKPIVLHTRDAEEDTVKILEKERASETGGVAHCFSGSVDMAKRLIDMNFFISFAGQVTFKKAENMIKLIESIPIEQMLIETDCPYLSPEPFRGKRNEPANVLYVAKKIAEIKGLSEEDVGRITAINAINLFHIPTIFESKIVYPIRDSLYLNITNRCNNACGFCIRTKKDFVKGHFLHLDKEPSVDDIIKNIEPVINKYKEVVFCGYGEPFIRADVVLEVAKILKSKGVKHIRVNTNGQANLICKENIAPKFKGLIDELCISLNAPDKETYQKICQSIYGVESFDSILNFIMESKKIVPKVTLTFVDLQSLDLEACKNLANKLGVGYRIRNLDVVG